MNHFKYYELFSLILYLKQLYFNKLNLPKSYLAFH